MVGLGVMHRNHKGSDSTQTPKKQRVDGWKWDPLEVDYVRFPTLQTPRQSLHVKYVLASLGIGADAGLGQPACRPIEVLPGFVQCALAPWSWPQSGGNQRYLATVLRKSSRQTMVIW